jgi:signal transduction histidine kinase
LAVEDNGCGMTESVREHIFEPFFSVRRANRRGTGLGLSITRAIVESLGGSILVESAGVGLGSRFAAKIPACASLDALDAVEV